MFGLSVASLGGAFEAVGSALSTAVRTGTVGMWLESGKESVGLVFFRLFCFLVVCVCVTSIIYLVPLV